MSRTRAILTALLLACLSVGSVAAQTSLRLSAPFEPDRLTRQEKRIVQAALALEGHYDALLDGAWGGGSRQALRDWMRTTSGGNATWRDIRSLLRGFEAERVQNDWSGVWHADYGLWHLRPDGLLTRDDRADETRFYSPEGGLVMLARSGFGRPEALHDGFLRDAAPGSDPYTLRRETRMVTAARMRGGRHAYVRSDRGAAGWISHVVIADAANDGRLQLIASSFATRRAEGLASPDRGVVAALLRTSAAPLPEAPQRASDPLRSDDPLEAVLGLVLDRAIDRLLEDEAAPEPAPADPETDADSLLDRIARPDDRAPAPRRFRATAVFVNTTDLLTSARWIDVCPDGLALADGTRLRTLRRDGDRGLALLAAPGRSRDWVPLTADPSRRGDRLEVLARGRRGLASETGALLGIDRSGRLILDAGLDGPGRRGAALLDEDARLAGLWTGEVEGRDAFAAPAETLAAFLDAAEAPYVRGRPGPGSDAARAVEALRCAGF